MSLYFVLHARFEEYDGERSLHKAVAKLVAVRAGDTRAQEGMLIKDVYACKASWAQGIYRGHLHKKVIPYESAEVASA